MSHKTITEALEKFFAEQDEKIVAGDIAWAMDRVRAIKEFKQSERCAELRKQNLWSLYSAYFEICGGKTWYTVFTENTKDGIEEFMRKNAKAAIAKRNFRIAKKLTEKGVEEVTSAKVGYCTDGFRGVFHVNGERTVTVESILAGGYNIQRLHQRVLVKVK